MELTRRDALGALAVMSGGVGLGSALTAHGRRNQPSSGGVQNLAEGGPRANGRLRDHEIETMVAVARVVYPSVVSGIDEFVRAFLDRRVADRPDHASEIARVISRLDELGQDWHGGPFMTLDRATQDQLLREVGADTADADSAGTIAQRVRYYLINELLFALYASPVGGELVDIENPLGHPGGIESYQRGPPG